MIICIPSHVFKINIISIIIMQHMELCVITLPIYFGDYENVYTLPY